MTTLIDLAGLAVQQAAAAVGALAEFGGLDALVSTVTPSRTSYYNTCGRMYIRAANLHNGLTWLYALGPAPATGHNTPPPGLPFAATLAVVSAVTALEQAAHRFPADSGVQPPAPGWSTLTGSAASAVTDGLGTHAWAASPATPTKADVWDAARTIYQAFQAAQVHLERAALEVYAASRAPAPAPAPAVPAPTRPAFGPKFKSNPREWRDFEIAFKAFVASEPGWFSPAHRLRQFLVAQTEGPAAATIAAAAPDDAAAADDAVLAAQVDDLCAWCEDNVGEPARTRAERAKKEMREWRVKDTPGEWGIFLQRFLGYARDAGFITTLPGQPVRPTPLLLDRLVAKTRPSLRERVQRSLVDSLTENTWDEWVRRCAFADPETAPEPPRAARAAPLVEVAAAPQRPSGPRLFQFPPEVPEDRRRTRASFANPEAYRAWRDMLPQGTCYRCKRTPEQMRACPQGEHDAETCQWMTPAGARVSVPMAAAPPRRRRAAAAVAPAQTAREADSDDESGEE